MPVWFAQKKLLLLEKAIANAQAELAQEIHQQQRLAKEVDIKRQAILQDIAATAANASNK